MSRDALAKVIQRSISDGAFRRQLATDPTGALRGYDLSGDEFAAIKSGDSTRLTALGVEQRMSKAFTMSGDASGADSVSKAVTSDLGASWHGALTPTEGTTGNDALTPVDGASEHVLTPGDGATYNGALISGDGDDADAVIADVSGSAGNAAITGGDTAEALPDDIDPGFVPQFNVLTSGDTDAQSIIVSDDAAGGGSTPGEAIDGPNIQE
ncbi:MAG TPA: Os1348 family NHLP clan protein [Candidatus Limnocylindria bacterium]|nr:Os1348 family NHLP clan protein [Candidatus Limnocylindria bacterium]